VPKGWTRPLPFESAIWGTISVARASVLWRDINWLIDWLIDWLVSEADVASSAIPVSSTNVVTWVLTYLKVWHWHCVCLASPCATNNLAGSLTVCRCEHFCSVVLYCTCIFSRSTQGTLLSSQWIAICTLRLDVNACLVFLYELIMGYDQYYPYHPWL